MNELINTSAPVCVMKIPIFWSSITKAIIPTILFCSDSDKHRPKGLDTEKSLTQKGERPVKPVVYAVLYIIRLLDYSTGR